MKKVPNTFTPDEVNNAKEFKDKNITITHSFPSALMVVTDGRYFRVEPSKDGEHKTPLVVVRDNKQGLSTTIDLMTTTHFECGEFKGVFFVPVDSPESVEQVEETTGEEPPKTNGRRPYQPEQHVNYFAETEETKAKQDNTPKISWTDKALAGLITIGAAAVSIAVFIVAPVVVVWKVVVGVIGLIADTPLPDGVEELAAEMSEPEPV